MKMRREGSSRPAAGEHESQLSVNEHHHVTRTADKVCILPVMLHQRRCGRLVRASAGTVWITGL
jgi:hypothetical protein